tara:strand:- start:8010 stop:8234 length:225 start_codon:yes stop_codon:yes gene_type:complete
MLDRFKEKVKFGDVKMGGHFVHEGKSFTKVSLNLLYYTGMAGVRAGNNIFLPEFFEIEDDSPVTPIKTLVNITE